MKNVKNLLVVCGGNTCRSSMAKVILAQMLKSQGLDEQFHVDSAGYNGADGPAAHPDARQTIIEMYSSDFLADHTPKKLTKEMVDQADLILVMEDYMKAGLPAGKVIVLGISTPWGSGVHGYKACATKIQQSFQKNWPDIIHASPSSQKTSP